MIKLHIGYLVLLVATPFVLSFELPFLGTCTISDEECHIKSVDKFLELYINGIPELDVPSMEPFELGNITVESNSNENFNMKIQMDDIKLYRYAIAKCLSVKGFEQDASKPMKLTIEVSTPEVIATTIGNITGKLLLFNINGSTDVEMHLKNTSTVMKALTEPYTKDNHQYMKIKKFSAHIEIGSLKTSFKNSTLFGGNKALTDTLVQAINANWRLFNADIQPHLEAANAKKVTKILNKILDTMPFDRFFKKE